MKGGWTLWRPYLRVLFRCLYNLPWLLDSPSVGLAGWTWDRTKEMKWISWKSSFSVFGGSGLAGCMAGWEAARCPPVVQHYSSAASSAQPQSIRCYSSLTQTRDSRHICRRSWLFHMLSMYGYRHATVAVIWEIGGGTCDSSRDMTTILWHYW